MIIKIWIQIAFAMMVAVIPVTFLQMGLQKQSLEIIYNISEGVTKDVDFDKYLALLKDEAQRRPAVAAENKARFLKLLASKRAVEDFSQVKADLLADLASKTKLLILGILAMSLLISGVFSNLLVRRFRVLLAEKTKSEIKKEQVKSLQSWQKIASTLVHEIKAPITPMKMVASDIEEKYVSLDRTDFKKYLGRSQALVRKQVLAIEKMIEVFTKFAKLPEVERQAEDLNGFFREFSAVYSPILKQKIEIKSQDLSYQCSFDPKLMRDMLFNMVKNAIEANPSGEILVNITTEFDPEKKILKILLFNTGSIVPVGISEHMFEPYISNKKNGSSNMGLGLAISRKIAIDHGGDILLIQNDAQGVCFEVTITC